jgi:hypothetical protein
MTTSDTGVRMMGAILKYKGDGFASKLKTQDVSLHAVSGRAMADLAISGEVPISPSIFRDHAMESKLKGAPIDWVALEGVPTNAGATSIIYQAPHPHGAMLLADFILGPEGQKILEDLQFGSPSKDFGFKRWYPEAGLNTDQYDLAAVVTHEGAELLQGAGKLLLRVFLALTGVFYAVHQQVALLLTEGFHRAVVRRVVRRLAAAAHEQERHQYPGKPTLEPCAVDRNGTIGLYDHNDDVSVPGLRMAT